MDYFKRFSLKELTPEAIEQMQPASLQTAKSYIRLCNIVISITLFITLVIAFCSAFLFDVEELGKSILFSVFAIGLFIFTAIIKAKYKRVYKIIKTVYNGKEITKFQKTEGRINFLILMVAIIALFALIISFSIGLTNGSKSNGNECSSCGKTYSSGSPLDGYCNNCYQKIKNIHDIYEG